LLVPCTLPLAGATWLAGTQARGSVVDLVPCP